MRPRARGHSYVTPAADADARRVLVFVTVRTRRTIEELAQYLDLIPWLPEREHRLKQASTCPQPSLPVLPASANACITFDKFHVIGRQHGSRQDAQDRATYGQIPEGLA